MRLLQVTVFLLFNLSFSLKNEERDKPKLDNWNIDRKKHKYSKFEKKKADTGY